MILGENLYTQERDVPPADAQREMIPSRARRRCLSILSLNCVLGSMCVYLCAPGAITRRPGVHTFISLRAYKIKCEKCAQTHKHHAYEHQHPPTNSTSQTHGTFDWCIKKSIRTISWALFVNNKEKIDHKRWYKFEHDKHTYCGALRLKSKWLN
jgi:hypothetical protein